MNCPICNEPIKEYNDNIEIKIKPQTGAMYKHAYDRIWFMIHCYEDHTYQDFIEYLTDKIMKLD